MDGECCRFPRGNGDIKDLSLFFSLSYVSVGWDKGRVRGGRPIVQR